MLFTTKDKQNKKHVYQALFQNLFQTLNNTEKVYFEQVKKIST